MRNSKFRVAICGGGIGGLTLAIALAKSRDIQIDLYEAAQKFTEIGAGVGMFRRPWRVLKALGLADDLTKLANIPAEDSEALGFQFRKSDQPEGLSFRDFFMIMGNMAFHRADFQQALVKHIDDATTTSHFSKRLVSYKQVASDTESPSITLQFRDGSTATCDVLIGADGIHSVTRAHMLRDCAAEAPSTKQAEEFRSMIDPVWSGSVAYRGVIPREKLEAAAPGHRAASGALNYMGKNKHIIAFPISQGRLVNVVAFCSIPEMEGTVFAGKTVQERSQQEMLDHFVGWEPEVEALLKCIEKPSMWAVNNLKELPMYVHGRVALLGDAAHAMTPHQGSGAGQSIEDAYILATVLSHPNTTLHTLPDALKVYETLRLPHATGVLRRSRNSGKLYEFADARFADLAVPDPDAQRLQELGDAAEQNWQWAWRTDLEPDRETAIRLLDESLPVS